MEKLLNYIENFKQSLYWDFTGLLYSFYTFSSGQLCLCSNQFTHKDEDFGDTYWSGAVSIVYAVSGDLLLNIRPIRIPLVGSTCILLFISLVIYFIHFRKEKNELHSSN